MGQSDGLFIHPLPKHSWPATQKGKLDQPGAADQFMSIAAGLSEQMAACVSPQEQATKFHHLIKGYQSVINQCKYDRSLAVFSDLKINDSPGGSRPRHRAVAVSYNQAALSRGRGNLFPVESPIPLLEELRVRRYEAILQAAFLLIGDAKSRAFRGTRVSDILQNSLCAMGVENFAMLDPQKAFQNSSFTHVGVPLGLLSQLTFLYQCEILEDARVVLSAVWVKIVVDDKDSVGSDDDGGRRLKFCKAPIESFDVTNCDQAAKLLAWFRAISRWSLKERLEAVRMAQRLDEVRQRRFQATNIAILQEFGADLATSWLAEDVLRAFPASYPVQRPQIRSAESGSARSRHSSAKHLKRKRMTTPPAPPPSPPPTMAWQSLIPPHKLQGFPRETSRGPLGNADKTPEMPDKKAGASSQTTVSKGRSVVSGDKTKQALGHRLIQMTAVYDAVLSNPDKKSYLESQGPTPIQEMPIALSDSAAGSTRPSQSRPAPNPKKQLPRLHTSSSYTLFARARPPLTPYPMTGPVPVSA